MAQRCALIVDDSPTARRALAAVLAGYQLRVDTAQSAEEALEYLGRSRPDVIFMDHLMPGMDGLQAVQAIKKNPATATIPIMMYTSQEGEVYVGQARALGAVGVLPKQIKPVEVSRVLQSLHLVEGGVADVAVARPAPEAPRPSTVATDLNHRDWTDLHSWLQEMFDHLGSDLRRDVEASVTRLLQERDALPPPRRAPALLAPMALTVVLAAIAAVFFWLHLDTQRQWRAAVEQNAGLMAALNARRDGVAAPAPDATSRPPAAAVSAAVPPAVLSALEWSVNQSATYPQDQPAFGDERLEKVSGLLQKLTQLGFAGRIHLDSYAGDFCYQGGGDAPPLAPDELPAERCDRIAPEEARATAGRQSVAFAGFMSARDPAATIRIELEPHGNMAVVAPYPPSPVGLTAGEWNRIARQNNRVTIRLLAE
jgi:CheY-like chemotaxis protein